MQSGPVALRALRVNTLPTLAAVKESPQVLVAGRVSGIVLKVSKDVVQLVWEQDIGVRDGDGFLFVIRD
jgi:hypothetical protein